MDGHREWLKRTKEHAIILSEAYQLRLGRLWWANLVFVVLPAVFTTAAAILAALPKSTDAAAWLAGAAAVLMAVHRALKCEEYQVECLRLSQAYRGIAIAADAELSSSDTERHSNNELAKRLDELTLSVKAALPTSYLKKVKGKWQNT